MTVALVIAFARLVGALQPVEPVSFSVTRVEDTHPQIIHIYNLDEGPRAIVLPPAPSEDSDPSRPIRIFNASGEGVQELDQPLKPAFQPPAQTDWVESSRSLPVWRRPQAVVM